MILQYLYGPVFSWRLGRSLGIDLISTKEKSCNFDCKYCQIGRTENFIEERKIFVQTEDVMRELKKIDVDKNIKIDFLTFSGRGEPTLAANLGEVIYQIRKLEKFKNTKIALITNSSLIYSQKLQNEIKNLDVVMAKFDAWDFSRLRKINNPSRTVDFKKIYEGLKRFRKIFKGELELQVMFVDDNKNDYQEIISLIKEIAPDRVHINTPLRPSEVAPLGEVEIAKIKQDFEVLKEFGIKVESVYDVKKEPIKPIDEKSTVLRRGKE